MGALERSWWSKTECFPCLTEAVRGRAPIAVCDGPRPSASLRTSPTCDTPVCADHRTIAADGFDRCPWCAGTARKASPKQTDLFGVVA